MATSAPTSVPMWLTGCTYDGNGGADLRNSGVTPWVYPSGPASGSSSVGVLPGVLAAGLPVVPAGGMTVAVGGGSFVVASSTAAEGGYAASLSGEAIFTVATADPVNPRVDLVCCTVTDNGNSTSGGKVQIITGTPAPSPSPPALPAQSTPLAHVAVAALATSISSGNVTDVRTYTCAVGGVVIAPKTSAPAGWPGCPAYDPTDGVFYHNYTTGPVQMRTLPFAPVAANWESDQEISYSSPANVLQVGITLDGQTDLKVIYHVPGISMATPAAGQVKFQITIDGTLIGETDVFTYSIDEAGISGHGFTAIAVTGNSMAATPAAGYHDIALQAATTAGNPTYIVCASNRPCYLWVEPVAL